MLSASGVTFLSAPCFCKARTRLSPDQRLLKHVPRRALSRSRQSCRTHGRNKVRVPRHPWDELGMRSSLGSIYSSSWSPGGGLGNQNLCTEAWGTNGALPCECRNAPVPMCLKSSSLTSCSTVCGQQGLKEFHLGTTAPLTRQNLIRSSYLTRWPCCGHWSRRGTGRLFRNQAPLKDIVLPSHSLVPSPTTGSVCLEDATTHLCTRTPALVADQHNAASCSWFPWTRDICIKYKSK